MSRVKLARETGDATEDLRELAAVYAAFTEGFDTRDLIDARSLLESAAAAAQDGALSAPRSARG